MGHQADLPKKVSSTNFAFEVYLTWPNKTD